MEAVMKISDVLKSNERGVSFEFFPPKTEEARARFIEVARELEEHRPLYVSVTYGAGGSTQDRTRETLFELKKDTGLTLMSHLTCIGARREAIFSLLGQYRAHGIDNILALRGDPPHDMYEFDRSAGEFQYARDLVEFVKGYGHFSIGVAVYPEGHQEAPSLEADLDHVKEKVEAGGEFGIAQMFFDNAYFYNFLDKARKKGIEVPMIPGIMPITDLEKIKKFASFCGVTVPGEVEAGLAPAIGRPEEMFKRGVDLCIRQCRDLMENGVRYLHFYTLNRSEAVNAVLKGLGIP
jgi:methylenetetrahydrofolate reductase (NADPH)